MIKTILKFQVVKQILGALGGAMIALALYHTYRWSAQTFQAFLLTPGAEQGREIPDGVRLAAQEGTQNQDTYERVAARARAAAENMRRVQQARIEHAVPAAMPAVVPAPVIQESSAASSAAPLAAVAYPQPPAPAETLHAGAAPALPGSGVGLGVVAAAAFGAALMGRKALRGKLFSR